MTGEKGPVSIAPHKTAWLDLRGCGPVFHHQAIDTAELALVVGYQHPAFGAGVGGDPEVVVAYGRPARSSAARICP